MPHTNRAELSRLFSTFCHLWTKGLHANVQMKTTGSGGVVAQFEFELGKPHKTFPAGLAGFWRGQTHGDPRRHRVTSQALPMPRANPEQREAVVIALVVEGRKLLSAHDCAPQLTRHPWQLHAALQKQQQYLCRLLRLLRLPLDHQQSV